MTLSRSSVISSTALVVDVEPIELLLQRLEHLQRDIGIQPPGATDGLVSSSQPYAAAALVPVRTSAASCSSARRRPRGSWRTISVARRRSRGARSTSFPACQACARPGQLLRVLEQPDALVRERLVAAGQANQRPGVAWTERSTAVATGHQPALEAGAVDAQRSRRAVVVRFGGDQVARAQQGIDARAIATEQTRRFSCRCVGRGRLTMV